MVKLAVKSAKNIGKSGKTVKGGADVKLAKKKKRVREERES